MVYRFLHLDPGVTSGSDPEPFTNRRRAQRRLCIWFIFTPVDQPDCSSDPELRSRFCSADWSYNIKQFESNVNKFSLWGAQNQQGPGSGGYTLNSIVVFLRRAEDPVLIRVVPPVYAELSTHCWTQKHHLCKISLLISDLYLLTAVLLDWSTSSTEVVFGGFSVILQQRRPFCKSPCWCV